jgi:HSP20 family protein
MLEKSEKDLLRKDEPQQGQGNLRNTEQGNRSLSPIAQMDRLFDEVFKRPFFSLWSPRLAGEEMEPLYLPVDIFEDGESVIVKAEIPGIKKEDINVQLAPDSITISGKKTGEERVERKDYYRVERSYGSFSRTCRLPAEILTDKARAVFKDGVLEVRIPKSMESAQRVKKVTVE